MLVGVIATQLEYNSKSLRRSSKLQHFGEGIHTALTIKVGRKSVERTTKDDYWFDIQLT